MSYGHAGKLAAIVAGAQAAAGEKPAPPIDPALYRREDVRRILAERDIGALYRVLKDDAGLTQRQIAELTGQSQSEVSEILKGRQVRDVTVLERIAEGLGVPRELMGLSYGERSAYGGQGTAVSPEEVAAMLRRQLMKLAPITLAHNPLTRLAELLEDFELSGPSPVPLPARLGPVHVDRVRDMTRRLAEARRIYGSDPEMSSAAATQATQLLNVPGADAVMKAMTTAVAQLHLQAGWSGFDSDLYDRAMYHYARALELAVKAGDSYFQALALSWAGLATIEHGDPNEGLKILQLGGTKVLDVPSELDPSVVVFGERSRIAVQACMCTDSAIAYHRLDYPEAEREADKHLAKGRELWSLTPADTGGDVDRPAACIALDRGQLDAAESYSVASLRRWEGANQVGRLNSAIVLSTIYVRAGESRGLQLAHSAIAAAENLTSIRPRKRLAPLVDALEAQSNSDAQQLARMARQVAATRA